jgi:hypothetical protein
MTTHDNERDAVGREVTRFIPVPTSVSEQAQQFLAMDMFGGDASSPAADDVDGWRSMIRGANEILVAAMSPRIEHLRSRTESTTVDEVPSWFPKA